MKDIIILHLRKSRLLSKSVETYFHDISRNVFGDSFRVKIVVSPLESRGVINRIFLLIYMLFFRNKINHIGGDFSFLAISLIGKPYILSILDLVFLRSRNLFQTYIFKIFWLYLPIRYSYKTIVISNSVRNEILKIYPWFCSINSDTMRLKISGFCACNQWPVPFNVFALACGN